jgi:hypothetical protein
VPIKADLVVDVTGSCDIEGPLHIAATLFLPAPDRLTGEPAVIFALPGGGYSRGYYDMHFDGHLGYSQPAVVWTVGHMIGLQMIADQIRAQQCANAERSHTAWVYPQSKDEPKLLVALSESAENPNTPSAPGLLTAN